MDTKFISINKAALVQHHVTFYMLINAKLVFFGRRKFRKLLYIMYKKIQISQQLLLVDFVLLRMLTYEQIYDMNKRKSKQMQIILILIMKKHIDHIKATDSQISKRRRSSSFLIGCRSASMEGVLAERRGLERTSLKILSQL